ncbi:MAG: helix-hairpin-helix domain-containing protein [Nocardioides sp.]|nr:helix-hairpin-helix domain-containing protein [Nocardioides sp.]
MSDRALHLVKSWLWALVPLWTLGFGSAAAMAHAAVKRHSLRQALTLPLYLAGLCAVLMFDPDNGAREEFIFGVGMTLNMGIALVHAVAIRSWVFPAPRQQDGLKDQQQRALAAMRAAAQARAVARRMMDDDPDLARRLQIGRPDLPGREYPDGGLVDVNAVDDRTLATHTGLPRALVDRIVAVRRQVGRFSSYEELLLLSNADPRELDRVREYLVFGS